MRGFLLLSLLRIVMELQAEDCKLSTANSNISWVVSIRKKGERNIICIGVIIQNNFVLIPAWCLSKKYEANAFYIGPELQAVTGESENGSCIQLRDGLNYESFVTYSHRAQDKTSNPYARNVARLEVKPFFVDGAHNPCKEVDLLLPKGEHEAEDYLKRMALSQILNETPFCQVPMFGEDNGFANNITMTRVYLIEKERCKSLYCPQGNLSQNIECAYVWWESDTHECFSFGPELSGHCLEHNVGAPLICEGMIYGTVKTCTTPIPVIVQRITSDHLMATLSDDDLTNKGGNSERTNNLWKWNMILWSGLIFDSFV